LSVPDLERLGVKRVSIGGSLAVAALAFVQRAMRELREHGTFSYGPAALSNASTNAIMARYRG
jgi:2-methylisocitrate lyase-like PEP mutase family enzyme